ncbi:MAG: hypothetical protein CGEMS_0941 [Candidatus Campylobacter infans]|nr:MAG: hypothetical protein CGEMS_0941 [Candidatus Campylobacter infans]
MKKAISLLELLLAIIVVGIGASAIPPIVMATTKANEQTILSEVVTSTRIMIDELLLEPYNSVLANGFTGKSGATLYTGIVKTVDCADDTSCDSKDRRFNKNATQYFSRSLAVNSSGEFVKAENLASKSGEANTPGSANYALGLNNRKNAVERSIDTGTGNRNLIKFKSLAKASFLEITGDTADNKSELNVTFDLSNTGDAAKNVMVVDVNSSFDNNSKIGGVENVILYGFAFNISEESK